MITFQNIDNLIRWLDENLAAYDLAAVKCDIKRQYDETGSAHYELASWETISGNPECYAYDVEVTHNEEEDSYDYTFIF